METGNEFLVAGLLLISALFAGKGADILGFPRVAAYLLVGVLFSPGLLGSRFDLPIGAWTEGFTTGALGVIAYLVGGSITAGQLRRLGRVIVVSALGESLGAMLFVFLAVLGFLAFQGNTETLLLALAFAVLAVSTAPAATLAVIHQYRTKGPMTDTLLGVMALDDAAGIICFSLLLALAADNSLTSGFISAGIEIGGALLLGAFGGLLLSRISALFGESAARLPLLFSSILLILGIAHSLQLSLLLAAMSLGFAARHFAHASAKRLFSPIHNLEETIFLLFFTLAGTHFDILLFQQHIDLITIYVLSRIAGKMAGAGIGSRLTAAQTVIVRWLGLGLIPQAGVAVGLALILSHQSVFAQTGQMIVNVILGTTLIYELLGPLAAQFALRQAGEVNLKREICSIHLSREAALNRYHRGYFMSQHPF
jgi:Kef-type K+ transport system membrane component KefB